MNNNDLNTARAPNIKADSPEVKEIIDFAERVRYMLDVKINHSRIAMQKSDNLPNIDMFTIRIQALEWVQGKMQDLILSATCHKRFRLVIVIIIVVVLVASKEQSKYYEIP